MNYAMILQEVNYEIKSLKGEGEVATYIPELSKVDSTKFGIHLITLHGKNYSSGQSNERFSIQSISKVLTVSLAYRLIGEKIWQRVGVEPSGDPFNSLTLLEYEHGIPRNPLINSGALVIADILLSELKQPKKDFLAFIRQLANNDRIDYDLRVVASEIKHGYLNSALVNLLKSYDNIVNEPNDVLDFYYHTCAIGMTCKELAGAFLFLANHGKLVGSNDEVLTLSQTKRINALMQLCGFYDEAGEFAFRVGIPGKSGVGGGIVAVHPQHHSVAVWSPRLNAKGNSVMGMKALELLTTKTGFSIF